MAIPAKTTASRLPSSRNRSARSSARPICSAPPLTPKRRIPSGRFAATSALHSASASESPATSSLYVTRLPGWITPVCSTSSQCIKIRGPTALNPPPRSGSFSSTFLAGKRARPISSSSPISISIEAKSRLSSHNSPGIGPRSTGCPRAKGVSPAISVPLSGYPSSTAFTDPSCARSSENAMDKNSTVRVVSSPNALALAAYWAGIGLLEDRTRSAAMKDADSSASARCRRSTKNPMVVTVPTAIIIAEINNPSSPPRNSRRSMVSASRINVIALLPHYGRPLFQPLTESTGRTAVQDWRRGSQE